MLWYMASNIMHQVDGIKVGNLSYEIYLFAHENYSCIKIVFVVV